MLTSSAVTIIIKQCKVIANDYCVAGLYYSTPLRLDVYKNGVIINPTNADIVDGKYKLRPKDPSLPDDQVSPISQKPIERQTS